MELKEELFPFQGLRSSVDVSLTKGPQKLTNLKPYTPLSCNNINSLYFPARALRGEIFNNLGLVNSSFWASYNFASELQLPQVFVEL